MQRVKSDEYFQAAQKHQFEGRLDQAEVMYHQLLNKNMGNPNILYFLATLYMARGFNGLGAFLMKYVVEAMPDFAVAWNNLGVALKEEHMDEEAALAFQKAAEADPENDHYASNMASLYINTGQPAKCLEAAEKALKINPDNPQSKWHKALALLEMQRWGEAWDWHEARYDDEGCKIAVRRYASHGETPLWQGEKKGFLVVHGEQGLGDEIMFASCFPDLREYFDGRIVFECAPRLQQLLRNSLDGIDVFGTHDLDGRKWKDKFGEPDFKVGVGSLPKYFRRSEEAFPGTAYLTAPESLRKKWRAKLSSLGKKPKIGLTWQGGAQKTRVDLRSIMLNRLKDLICDDDYAFISLQYTDAAKGECEEFWRQTGYRIRHWDHGCGNGDFAEHAALVSELDYVLTVCQTAVHVAGGLGIPTSVLTPSCPSWRYGVTGNMPWYSSVDLIRQEGNDWSTAVNEARTRLATYFRDVQAA